MTLPGTSPGESPNHQRERRSIVIFMLVLLALSGTILWPFFIPIVLAVILSTLFFPIYTNIKAKFKSRARLASLATTLSIFFIFIVPSTLVISLLVGETRQLAESLDFRATFERLFSNAYYNTYIDPYVRVIEQRFRIDIDIATIAADLGQKAANYVYGFSPQVLSTTASFIFYFFIMIVCVYFFFLEGPKLLRIFIDLSPLRNTHDGKLLHEVREVIYASVYGYLLTALVQGILAFAGFAVIGVPTAIAMVLGLATFFFSMIPVIGAAGVWIPVAIWLFIQGSTGKGIGFLFYGALIISGIDNVLKPLIIQGRTRIHPLLIFFSIFGGILALGPVGILIGPVLISLLIATISIYREEFI